MMLKRKTNRTGERDEKKMHSQDGVGGKKKKGGGSGHARRPR